MIRGAHSGAAEQRIEEIEELREAFIALRKLDSFKKIMAHFEGRLLSLELEIDGRQPEKSIHLDLACLLARRQEIKWVLEAPDRLRRELESLETPRQPLRSKGE